jgi:hypothetical protein
MELFGLPLWPFLLLFVAVGLALCYRFALRPGKVAPPEAAIDVSTSTAGRTITREGWYGS